MTYCTYHRVAIDGTEATNVQLANNHRSIVWDGQKQTNKLLEYVSNKKIKKYIRAYYIKFSTFFFSVRKYYKYDHYCNSWQVLQTLKCHCNGGQSILSITNAINLQDSCH